ncbi:MAG: hypothetical protein K2M59_06795 [Muribaculaceae bacterium]|nr:hypothetical protein [Muribaculaceae bacterium]
MKKTTLPLVIAAAFSLSSATAMAEAPVFNWGNLFDGGTSAGDTSQGIAVATDGNVYWHNIGGSTKSALDISYAGEVLFQGAPYVGTSNNGNLCVIKTSSDGKALWNLHSESGDYASNDGKIVATTDGGAVFTARVRHTDGMLDTPLTIVDGTGSRHTYEWKVDRRYYRVMVGRLDPTGKLVWTRFIDCDTSPAPAATGNYADFTSDAISIPALTVDSDNNIYIGGNFRSVMSVPTATGSVKIEPRNVSSWNGDSQQNAGGLFLVKLNNEGYYDAHLSISGESIKEVINSIVWDNGALYWQALINPAQQQGTLNVGGKAFTPQGDFTPVVGKLDSDLHTIWLDPLKGEFMNGKYGFQSCNVSISGDNVWFTGMFNGSVYDPNGKPFFASTQATLREGFLARINAATGECIKGVSSREAFPGNVLTGYISAVQSPNEQSKVYVYGYGMNAAIGIFLREYDAETLVSSEDKAWPLATQGGVPTANACGINYETREFYFSGRGNKAFDCSGKSIADNSGWAVLMGAYTLPEANFPTSVVSAIESASEVKCESSEGGIVITCESPVHVNIFNLAGCCIRSVDVEGSIYVSLPAGLYIVAGKKVVVR